VSDGVISYTTGVLITPYLTYLVTEISTFGFSRILDKVLDQVGLLQQ